MKRTKLITALVAFLCTTIFNVIGATPTEKTASLPLGIPYSLDYIAKHSPKSSINQSYSSVIFHVAGAGYNSQQKFTWRVSFYQDGIEMYSFNTYDQPSLWNYYSSNDETYNGTTVAPAAGTYDVVITNMSGYGGYYDSSISFDNANGNTDGVWVQDVNTTYNDIHLNGVYVNGTTRLELYVVKTSM